MSHIRDHRIENLENIRGERLRDTYRDEEKKERQHYS